MERSSPEKKRRTKRPSRCPNILFEKWLQDLQQSVPEDSRMKQIYGRALKSLQLHPLKLKSGKECMILKHFGQKLCGILDKKLDAHLQNGGNMSDLHHASESSDDEGVLLKQISTGKTQDDRCPQSARKPKRKIPKEYVPAPRTGSYAVLVTLHQLTLDPGHKGFLTKAELIDRAQPGCDASFTRPSDPNSRYTAWSSVSGLISKNLVEKSGNPSRFSLTREGVELAEKIVAVTLNGPSATARGSDSVSEPEEPEVPPPKKKRMVNVFRKNTNKEKSKNDAKIDTGLPLSNRSYGSVMQIDSDDDDRRSFTVSKSKLTSQEIIISDSSDDGKGMSQPSNLSRQTQNSFVSRSGSPVRKVVEKRVSDPIVSLGADGGHCPVKSADNITDEGAASQGRKAPKFVFKPKTWTGLGAVCSSSQITTVSSQQGIHHVDGYQVNPCTNSGGSNAALTTASYVTKSSVKSESLCKGDNRDHPESDDSLPDFSDLFGRSITGKNSSIEAPAFTVTSKKPKFLYVYVDVDGKATRLKDRAEVLFQEIDFFTGYGCYCVKKDLFTSGRKYRNLSERDNGIVKVFLDDSCCGDLAPCSSLREIEPIPPRTCSTLVSVQPFPPLSTRGRPEEIFPDSRNSLSSVGSTTTEIVPNSRTAFQIQPKNKQHKAVSLLKVGCDLSSQGLRALEDQSPTAAKSSPVVSLTGHSLPSISQTVASSSSQSLTSQRCLVPQTKSSSDFTNLLHTVSVSSSAVLSREATSRDSSQSVEVDPIVFMPGSFKVILLVDTGETAGSLARSNQKVITHDELKKQDMPFEVRRLSVGDYLWVARSTTNPDLELVLPFIIERKRMDDLACSIKDGRYKEQKFRMRRSGIQNLIYLVEEYGSRQHLGLPERSVIQAVINTQIVDDFRIRWTKSTAESVSYVKRMTTLLAKKYSAKTLVSSSATERSTSTDSETLMTFKEFSKHCNKRKALTITETFGKQLMQLHGVSGKKAAAIISRFPTPDSLFQAYEASSSEKDREELISGGKTSKTGISAQISKTIHMLYSCKFL